MHPIVPGMLPTVSSEPSRVTPPRALRRPQDWRDWVGLALRLLTGVVMIWAGATKIGNLPLNVEQVKLYQLGLGDTLSTLIGYAQPPLESSSERYWSLACSRASPRCSTAWR